MCDKMKKNTINDLLSREIESINDPSLKSVSLILPLMAALYEKRQNNLRFHSESLTGHGHEVIAMTQIVCLAPRS